MNDRVQVKSISDLKRFKLEMLDVDKFVKTNECEPITNPIYFIRDGIPTPDGLFSNEIFGITQVDRSGIYAYIDLHSYFFHPLIYKILTRMNRSIRECVHGTKHFIINNNGDLVEDANGETGIEFLRKNFDKIKLKETDSRKRSLRIKFIEDNKDNIFINKYIVIPPFYRDVKSNDTSQGVGDINKMYDGLIISSNSLKESSDYGFFTVDSVKGRIQESLMGIYDWFSQEPQLAKKNGIIRRAGMSKTVDYATRLVISAPNMRVESYKDIDVNNEYSALPLASACANFFPFMVFIIRRMFENAFSGNATQKYIDDDELKVANIIDPMIYFSDEVIKKELERFAKGTTSRFNPITIPNDSGKEIYLKIKGYNNQTVAFDRVLTWCDIIYMAAVEASRNRCILITRYPFDSYFSQFPTLVTISSTVNTENVIVNGTHYPKYPKIRKEDIGKDTSNLFCDTLNMSNVFLTGIKGDYDGDQVTVRAVFTDEANAELISHLHNKARFIKSNGVNSRVSTNECIQALYSLTLILSDMKLTEAQF